MTDTIQNREAAESGDWALRNAVIQRWILFAFLLLFVATVFLIAPQIQLKLDRLTKARLQQAGVNPDSIQLDWNYRDLTVTGYLPANVSHQEFATIIRGTGASGSGLFAEGIRHLQLDLDDAGYIGIAEEALAVQVQSDSDVSTIDGVVQSDAQRELLVQAMLDSGAVDILDNLEVSGGSSKPFIDKKLSLLANIIREAGPSQSSRTEIKMTESDLNYRIAALDKHSALAIEKAAAIKIEDFRITGGVDVPGSQHLDIQMHANGETITLGGIVHSEAHRKRLLFSAGEAVGSSNVVDQLTLVQSPFGSSESMTQVDGVAAVISRFAPGITGEVRLLGPDLVIDADAGSEPVRDYLLTAAASARSSGLNVTENVRLYLPVDDAQALQTKLDGLIDEVRDSVVFASGDSVLTPRAMQSLNKVSAHISEYSDLMVEIEGHTDNVGRAIVNEQLSQSRASAVRNYLAQSVDGGRLIAVGYGHRKPIDSNDNAEGRQANRRVHFTVLKRPEIPSKQQ